MKQTKCRVCGNLFFDEPLLRLRNMPKSAQYLPGAKALKNDKGVDLEVCQCSGCGLVQLNNAPVPYYREVIRASAVSAEMRAFRRKQFAGFVKKYQLKGKKIVEIGCGRGEYLSVMQKTGVKAYGLEYLPASVEYCNRHGLKAFKGFVGNSSYRIKNAPYSAFFSMSFLEHFPDPNSALRGIFRNLADNAVGLVEVPNFNMILKRKLFSEFITDHLLYFTKETLNAALNLNGFEIVECKEVWHDYIISAVVKKKTELDISGFYKYQTKLKNEMRKYLGRFKREKVAIWGAGHQALAVISLLNLAGKIKYVIDSASFKQGKYTPATHIPILAPEALMSDPVDAIIVMAASYSDEVAGILRQKYGPRINISILRDYGLEVVRK